MDARDKIEVLFCPLDDLLNLGDELLLLDDFDFFEGDDDGVEFVFVDGSASDVRVGDGIVLLLVDSIDLVESFCWCCCCCLPLKSYQDVPLSFHYILPHKTNDLQQLLFLLSLNGFSIFLLAYNQDHLIRNALLQNCMVMCLQCI